MGKFIETESRLEVNGAGEGRNRELCYLMVTEFVFGVTSFGNR